MCSSYHNISKYTCGPRCTQVLSFHCIQERTIHKKNKFKQCNFFLLNYYTCQSYPWVVFTINKIYPPKPKYAHPKMLYVELFFFCTYSPGLLFIHSFKPSSDVTSSRSYLPTKLPLFLCATGYPLPCSTPKPFTNHFYHICQSR